MDTHLEEQRTQIQPDQPAVRNRRNGHSKKTIKGEFGEAEIIVPKRSQSASLSQSLLRKDRHGLTGLTTRF